MPRFILHGHKKKNYDMYEYCGSGRRGVGRLMEHFQNSGGFSFSCLCPGRASLGFCKLRRVNFFLRSDVFSMLCSVHLLHLL